MLAGPDIDGVAIDHEWQIAEDRDAVPARRAACVPPLRRREPLQVLVEDHVAREIAPHAVDGRRVATAQWLGPLSPWPLALVGVDRAKQRVVLDPPRLPRHELAKRPRAVGVAAPLNFVEACERLGQHLVFQSSNGGVVHAP